MTKSAGEILIEYVCPALGCITASLMFFAPVHSVRESVQQGSLGPLNPTPFAFMTGNTMGWIAYGFITLDPFVFVANAPGFIVSVWLNLCAVKLIYQGHASQSMRSSMTQLIKRHPERLSITLSDPEDRHFETGAQERNAAEVASKLWEQSIQLVTLDKAPVAHEIMVVGIVSFWTLILALVAYIPMSQTQRQLLVGIVVNVNLVFFYGAPLSTIFAVLESRDSSSIHVRTMITNTANGAFWFAYGLGIKDLFIAIPNGLGSLLGVVQGILCLLLPRKQEQEASTNLQVEIVSGVETVLTAPVVASVDTEGTVVVDSTKQPANLSAPVLPSNESNV